MSTLTSMRLLVSFHLKLNNLPEIKESFSDVDVIGKGRETENCITYNLRIHAIQWFTTKP